MQVGVADLTGILRQGPGGDRLAGWPTDLRIIASRTPRTVAEQAPLGENAHWRYGAFVTNTIGDQTQWLDARHRTQAHVEDNIKELKAMGAEKLPTADTGRNAVWLQLAAVAVTLTAWLRHLALDGELTTAEPKALRLRLLAVPARLVRHARKTDPEAPRKLGLGRRPDQRLDPAPSPPPQLTRAPHGPTTKEGHASPAVEPAANRARTTPARPPPKPNAPRPTSGPISRDRHGTGPHESSRLVPCR